MAPSRISLQPQQFLPGPVFFLNKKNCICIIQTEMDVLINIFFLGFEENALESEDESEIILDFKEEDTWPMDKDDSENKVQPAYEFLRTLNQGG